MQKHLANIGIGAGICLVFTIVFAKMFGNGFAGLGGWLGDQGPEVFIAGILVAILLKERS